MPRKFYRLHRRLATGRDRHVRRLKVLSRHPFMVPVFALLLPTALLSCVVWLLLSHGADLKANNTDIVIISYDHQVRTVPSHEATVGALLSKLKIVINTGDVVEPATDTRINQDDFRINIYRAEPVKIVDGSQNIYGNSAATTPRSIAKQTDVTVFPEDALAKQPVINFLRERAIGNVIVIDRSVPVTLDVNGFAAATRTRAKTVGAFLEEKHIALGQTGTVQPGLLSPVTGDQTIHVVRDGTGIQSKTETIAMNTQYANDDTLAYGTFAVRQAGNLGQQVLTYRVTVQKGKIVSSTLIQRVVTVQEVDQIEARGTNLSGIKGDMARAGISPDDYQYADYIISHESGWCPTKAQGQWGGCPAYAGYVPSYGGYGLCQSTPGVKMAAAGADWATNPITQLRWCAGYALAHYGSWGAAYQHWVNFHWW